MRYAIVDIETTGGSPKTSRITEIAIFVHDGTKVVDEFTSLINPEIRIPPFITSLTGITNEMVADAPYFYEVAKKIVELTEDAIFVAHNAAFDYSFVQAEFKSLGYEFKRETLCTVKLSRKLIPGHKSYSLGNLCTDLNIAINGRHRAAGDAFATTKLFDILLANQSLTGSEGFNQTDYGNLHPNLNLKEIKSLPELCGVYYFHDEQGNILYVGKSRNIRNRVLSHLSNNETKRAQKMKTQIASVSVELTGSEIVALLLESAEIKTHKPLFNRAQRRTGESFGIFSYINTGGYQCFEIGNLKDEKKEPLLSFENKDVASKFMRKLVDDFQLCLKLCGLYDSQGCCFNYEIGMCNGACVGKEPVAVYNKRVMKALGRIDFSSPNMLIIDKGRRDDERAAVVIRNGKYMGFGFFEPDFIQSPDEILEVIERKADNRDTRRIINNYLAKNKVERIVKF